MVKYWLERADKQFPHHPVVFQLKEKLLKIERPINNCEDLEALIACKCKRYFQHVENN